MTETVVLSVSPKPAVAFMPMPAFGLQPLAVEGPSGWDKADTVARVVNALARLGELFSDGF